MRATWEPSPGQAREGRRPAPRLNQQQHNSSERCSEGAQLVTPEGERSKVGEGARDAVGEVVVAEVDFCSYASWPSVLGMWA